MILRTSDIKTMVQAIRDRLKPKTLIGLDGAMGAGKTTFISELFDGQNVVVASPTYALYHVYEAFNLEIYHVDLYRLESSSEIDSAGYWDLFADSRAVILTEWLERVPARDLPIDWKKFFLKIEVDTDGKRTYTLS